VRQRDFPGNTFSPMLFSSEFSFLLLKGGSLVGHVPLSQFVAASRATTGKAGENQGNSGKDGENHTNVSTARAPKIAKQFEKMSHNLTTQAREHGKCDNDVDETNDTATEHLKCKIGSTARHAPFLGGYGYSRCLSKSMEPGSLKAAEFA